jgi:glycosyltransferase involved in cell wall biosynthesis
MRKILFDCEHLVHRLSSYTPIGMDRVAIRYLHHFVSNPDRFQTIGVMPHGRTCYFIEHRLVVSLCQLLFDTWISATMDTETFRERAVSLQKDFRETWPASWFKDWPIDPRLLEIRQQSPRDEFIYVNATQSGYAMTPDLVFMRTVLNAKIVCFVHDTIPMDFQEYIEGNDANRRAEIILNIGAIADLIVVNSISTGNDIIRHLTKSGIAAPRVEKLYIGVEEKFLELTASMPSAADEYSSPYFVIVGTIEPRKNHLLLLNIWREMANSGEGNLPKLVIVGARGWDNRNVLNMLDKCAAIKPYVIERTNLSDNEIVSLLKGALAILYPPFYEGWGMPLAEALSAGVPAVASDIAVFHECSQEKAIFLSPLDGLGWRSVILDLARAGSPSLQSLRSLASEYKPNTWLAHFEQLDFLLRDIATTRSRPLPPIPVAPERPPGRLKLAYWNLARKLERLHQ